MSLATDPSTEVMEASLTGAPVESLSMASVAVASKAPDKPAVKRPLVARLGGTASTIGWALVGLAVFAALWQFGASHVKDLPTPGATFSRLRVLLSHAFLNKGPNDKGVGLLLKASLIRVFTGFAIAAIVGIPLGLAMGSSQRIWKAMNPLSQLLRPVSPLAWYPILLVIFVNANKASVWVICMTSLWPIVLNTAAGASTVPKDQRNVARVFHLPMRSYVRHILVPHTLGPTITGLRLSMGTAWMVIVAVEMMSGKTGIGNYVWNQYNAGDMASVAASIILIGATGLILDFFFLRLGKAVTRQDAHS
jgi:nitrate/nitrite transport system permease protein